MNSSKTNVKTQPIGTIAPLSNVALFTELLERVTARHRNLPGMGAWYGWSGLGKTVSATYGAQRFRAYYIEVGSSWSQSKFCKSLLTELGMAARGTIAEMVEAIITMLAETNRPLIIDEFDHVVRRGFVEVVREIHDKSGAPIILIGEEYLPDKLKIFERFHNRVLDWVPAQTCDIADVAELARIYAPNLDIAPDLATFILTKSEKRARRISVNIDRVREQAVLNGWSSVDLKAWGDRPLFTGMAPVRRAV